MLLFVKNFSCNLNMAVFGKGIEQKAKILATGFGLDKGFHVLKGPDGLAGKAGGDQPPNEDEKCGGSGGEFEVVHFEDELPSDVVLADLGEDVNEEVEGGGGERRVREGLGIVEEGEGNFGIVDEAQEGLVEQLRRESDAVELQRRLHGVEGVVVVDKDL